MRLWLIMLGSGLALVGLQAVQAQVTIDITKITCHEFVTGQLTDSNTLSVWLNGYVNGARGRRSLTRFHQDASPWYIIARTTLTRWFWTLPETFLAPTNSCLAFMSAPEHTGAHHGLEGSCGNSATTSSTATYVQSQTWSMSMLR